ncbi:unnamed protein product, partial [Rotaria sordida]
EIHTNDIQHKPSIFRMIVYENRGSDISKVPVIQNFSTFYFYFYFYFYTSSDRAFDAESEYV